MKALGRQNLKTVFSISLHLFCFLSSSVCCWLFPQRRKSAVISLDSDGIGFCLVPFMSPPLRWGGGMRVAPCASTADSQPGASLQPAWPTGSCKALTFMVLLRSQPSSMGVFDLKWERGYYVIPLHYFDWYFFFLQAYLGRCSECSDKVNMV